MKNENNLIRVDSFNVKDLKTKYSRVFVCHYESEGTYSSYSEYSIIYANGKYLLKTEGSSKDMYEDSSEQEWYSSSRKNGWKPVTLDYLMKHGYVDEDGYIYSWTGNYGTLTEVFVIPQTAKGLHGNRTKPKRNSYCKTKFVCPEKMF